MANHHPTIGKDIPWKSVEGEGFRVESFVPLARLEQGKIKDLSKFMPYTLLSVDCPSVEHKSTEFTLPVLHKLDFQHLWELYQERGVEAEEEVVVSYSPQKRWWQKPFGKAFPYLLIEVYPKGSLEEIYRVYERKENAPKTEVDWHEFLERTRTIAEWQPIEGRVK